MAQVVVLFVVNHVVVTGEQDVGQTLGNDGAARMIDDEAFAHQPAHRDAILEERVHPRIGMRIIGRGRAVDGVAARVRSHGHDAHAIGHAPINRLQVLVIKGFDQQDGRYGFD